MPQAAPPVVIHFGFSLFRLVFTIIGGRSGFTMEEFKPPETQPWPTLRRFSGGTLTSFEREIAGRSLSEQHQYRFDNGYGASVVRGPYTYGGLDGLWELAVMLCDPKDETVWEITYETLITDDTLGRLTEAEVNHALEAIRSLPPRDGFSKPGPSSNESHETQRKIPPITAEDIEALRRSYSQ